MRPRVLVVLALALLVVAACGGLTSGSSGGGGNGSCVTIDLSIYDQSCNQDSDCIVLATGQICSGQCGCGGSAVSSSELSRWQAATSSIRFAACHCTAEQTPRCVNHVCTACSGPNPPAGCAGADGGACVTIDPTIFSHACTQDPDCIDITAGQICPGACLCGGGAAISRSEQARYDAMIAGIATQACPCPPLGVVRCIQSACTECPFGPNRPPGCPDGG
jgi:hypothetical protein